MGKEKMFCFPYAGGSSTLYEGNLSGLKEAFDLISLDYSGHGTKFGLPLYETMDEMVSELYKEVTEKLSKNEDYYLFGYSLGTIVAYQMACRLQENGYRLPKKMFLCSMEAPHTIPEDERIHKLSEEDFQNAMINMGGIDEELLKDPLMLKIFMPIIRRDFKLHEEYVGEKHDILDTSALVIYSDEDISNDKIRNWDNFIRSVEYLCYPGGHFFIYDKTDETVKEVIKRKNEQKADNRTVSDEIISFIQEYAKKQVDDITDDTTLPADLGIDSLTFVRMVNDAEGKFDVTIDDNELVKVRTVSDFAWLIKK